MYAWFVVQPFVSVALTVNEFVPAMVGIPDMIAVVVPLLEKTRPDDNEPPFNTKLYGVVPPVAPTDAK